MPGRAPVFRWKTLSGWSLWLLSLLAGSAWAKGQEVTWQRTRHRHPGAFRGATQKEQVDAQGTQEGLGHRLDGSPVPSSHLVLVFHPSTSHQETEGFLSREMKPERIQVWGTRGRIAGGVGREQVRSETKGQAFSANPPKGERSTPLASSPNAIKAGHPWNTAFLRTDILKGKVSRW